MDDDICIALGFCRIYSLMRNGVFKVNSKETIEGKVWKRTAGINFQKESTDLPF